MNQSKPLDIIILAAGKGSRMKSERPKVLHSLLGKTLIQRVLGALSQVSVRKITVVVGHGREAVISHLEAFESSETVETVIQEPQQGTGHAVMQVKSHWEKTHPVDRLGDVLILSGDVPLLRPETLKNLVATHQNAQADFTFLGAVLENPKGYGRLLAEGDDILGIVEDKDATPVQQDIQTVNAGIYCAHWQTIAPLLENISSGNAQGEFYLTDVVELARGAGLKLRLSLLEDAQEMLGVNQRSDLALCHQVLNQRTCERLMANGVTIIDQLHTLIAPEVSIGADSTVYPGTSLMGEQRFGLGCVLGPHTTINGEITAGSRVEIVHSVLTGPVTIDDDTTVGPYAHVRHGVQLSHHVAIGNFVEVKTSQVGAYTNAKHLAYLGNATLGDEVNIGAGTIIANYDPILDVKHDSVIEDGVKIGCNSVVVSPVTLKKHSSVAAGSVMTQDVSPWSLGIARERQVEVKDWVRKKIQHKQRDDS